MTALSEVSKFQMEMKGVFSPLLEKQILLTKNYFFVRRTQIGVKVCYRTFPIIMNDCSLDLPR